VHNAGELDLLVEQFTQSMGTATLVSRLEAAGIPVAEVRSPREAIRDPHVLARGETVPLLHPKYGELGDVIGTGLPIRFSDSATGGHKPASEIGEDNEAIYGGLLGYSAERIRDLAENKVV